VGAVIGMALSTATHGWQTLGVTGPLGFGYSLPPILLATLVSGVVQLIRRRPSSASLWLWAFWLFTAFFTAAGLFVLNRTP
jgi:hypothetical protein